VNNKGSQTEREVCVMKQVTYSMLFIHSFVLWSIDPLY